MANKVKPLVKPPSPSCVCQAANRYECMTRRHSTPAMPVSMHMARCMGGCPCACHKTTNGAEIANEAWARMRDAQ